jgi:hypothetical protein
LQRSAIDRAKLRAQRFMAPDYLVETRGETLAMERTAQAEPAA